MLPEMKNAFVPAVLLVAALALLVVSGIEPRDRVTWLLEVSPVLIGVPVLVFTYRRFPLSRIVYLLLFADAVILMVGGHYTYAEVPLGHWVQEALDLQRNPYDRLGHFAQGFVPALLAREILLRTSRLGGSRWLPFLVVCFCLAFSAFYELLEWWSAMVLGQSADQFLGTQGDPWDTQWDMFMALVGAGTSLALLGKAHDRSLRNTVQA